MSHSNCANLIQFDAVFLASHAGYFVKAATILGVILAIALPRVREYHPYGRFGAANLVTTARAGLVALVGAVIGEPHADGTLFMTIALALAATILDGVDGWIARRRRLQSAFGARFDVEVDSLLIFFLAILAWRYDKAGAWVLASGLTRYGFVAAGRVWRWMQRPLRGTFRGKLICIVQITGLLLALHPAIQRPDSAVIAGASLVALWYSFFVDTRALWTLRSPE
jgi:phosphatidylglycerophosphate synthase